MIFSSLSLQLANTVFWFVCSHLTGVFKREKETWICRVSAKIGRGGFITVLSHPSSKVNRLVSLFLPLQWPYGVG